MVAWVVGPTSTVFLVQYPQVTSGEEILPSDRASKSKTSKGVFKYYVSKYGGMGVKACDDNAYIILKHSLTGFRF